MSRFTIGLGLMAMIAAANGAAAQDAIRLTDGQLLKTVATNEAALDLHQLASAVEIRGIAKKIYRTETGDYVLQFMPDNHSDNFFRLEINFEFSKQDREQLGKLNLPAELTIRGAVKQSQWQPRYDNHRNYQLVIRDSQILATQPIWDLR
jgi:hypothetical protein